ncbi:MAG: 50S ribosomal protein L25 [Candidatus Woesebacteria bacterium GW2011_GWA1_39_21]|uniref:Large ribosomal subunit protein bL25 n=1 Tax=Candidatus Woesebacteria bacterium GW2011_GWA1_39_21 TaxID=1618550 RepID=A0A0G0N767_9BACT|nr:MAG: 50S ribosomal protein L25 [Candidatus Woesebacteria bacterium GW2011_GWA1_39_21]
MNKLSLKADKRTLTGRKVKKLRREGNIPANVYGFKVKSQAVTVGAKEFSEVYKSAGETSVIELAIGKETTPVLIHNIQHDPVDASYLHIDFLKIDLNKKVTTKIPLTIVGESPAVKQGLGTLVSYLDEVEVEALPGDLVDHIDVNVGSLAEANLGLAINDLKYDKAKLTITNDPETTVVKIEVQKEEPVEVTASVEEKAEEGAVAGEVKGGESEETSVGEKKSPENLQEDKKETK